MATNLRQGWRSRQVAIVVLALAPLTLGAWPVASQDAVDSRIWLRRTAEIEAYLREAEIVKLEDLSVGVTRPKKAHLAPGGPVAFLAWKTIPPGIYNGYFESYQSEVAAYELDKLLQLDMVPPTVERRYRGERGAAVMWVSPAKSFTDMGGAANVKPPSDKLTEWNRQIARAKMFHNLIANIDPNQGNWLVDPAWNVILIDHTRAFTTERSLVHPMTRIDRPLWDRMEALTEASLKPALGAWMRSGEIRAVLQRRDRMRQVVQTLIKDRGESEVFISPR